jgi:hypothetical protein
MTRLRCWGCLDGHHCRHTGYVPNGRILAPLPLPGLRPPTDPGAAVQPRPGRNDLGAYVDCGQPACKRPVDNLSGVSAR